MLGNEEHHIDNCTGLLGSPDIKVSNLQLDFFSKTHFFFTIQFSPIHKIAIFRLKFRDQKDENALALKKSKVLFSKKGCT